jgi:signal transduction histidine kinase
VLAVTAERSIEGADVIKVVEATQLDASSKTSISISQMAAALGHDLRTPLNAIVGSTSLLEGQFPEGSHDRVHLDRLMRNGRHLVAMLDGVLECCAQTPVSLRCR